MVLNRKSRKKTTKRIKHRKSRRKQSLKTRKSSRKQSRRTRRSKTARKHSKRKQQRVKRSIRIGRVLRDLTKHSDSRKKKLDRTRSTSGSVLSSKKSKKHSKKRSKKTSSNKRRKSGNCIKRSKLELNIHQSNAVKKFMKEDGYAFIHGVGSGKTLSAVTASQCFLDRYPKRKVIFVGPTSLLRNFEKELIRYGVTKHDIATKYEMLSFDGMMNRCKKQNPVNCKDNMLIIDEAHNLRNRKEGKKRKEHAHKSFSKKYQAVMECAQNAKKRLLLTATPVINNLSDLFALINFIYGRNIVGTREDVKIKHAEIAVGKVMNQENLNAIYRLLKGRVDYFTDISKSDFPLAKQHYVEVLMPREYKKQYERYIVKHEDNMDYYFEHPEAFYNAQRRVVNKIADDYFSKKIETILPKIRQGKTLIYTNWLDFGVTPIKETLDHANISYGIFTGKLSKEKRNELVTKFNDDEIDALILTSAGSEGLDLKGTKNVIILDPPWHPAGLNQIIGRAIRYQSHAHLPKNERNVQIYKMVMIEKGGMKWNNPNTKSGDALLYQIIEKKSHLTREIHDLFERISRSSVPSRKYQVESDDKHDDKHT